jgi:hypothetical protein
MAFSGDVYSMDPPPAELPEGVTRLPFNNPVNISGDGKNVLGFGDGDSSLMSDVQEIMRDDYTSLNSLISRFSGLPDGFSIISVDARGISHGGSSLFISGNVSLNQFIPGTPDTPPVFGPDPSHNPESPSAPAWVMIDPGTPGTPDQNILHERAFVFGGPAYNTPFLRLLANFMPGQDVYRSANDVSDDGSMAVGEESYGLNDNGSRALWWTDTTNSDLRPTLLNPLSGVDGDQKWSDDGAWASAMNGAGTRAVGASYFNDEDSFDQDGEYSQAVYWDLTGDSPVAKYIGSLRGDGSMGTGESDALDISRNGNWIVGWAQTDTGVSPFISNNGQGMIAIASPDADYSDYGEALGVSNDGTAVGHFHRNESLEQRSRYGSLAFVHNQDWGSKTVADWLESSGVQVAEGMHYLNATAISEDGKVIVGVAEEGDGEIGFIARAGSGSIDPAAFQSTLMDAGSVPPLITGVMNSVMNGSHHIPLQLMKGPSRHAWFTTDGGRWDRYNSNSLLTEAGLAVDLFDKQLLAGFGFGLNWLEQKNGAINSDLNGQYYLGELSYKPTDVPLVFTLTGSIGNWDADIRRNYLTAGLPDSSTGSTDITSRVLRFSVHWLDAFKVGGFGITPKIQYSVNDTTMDAYTENGGGFPAAFNKQSSTAQEMRYGLWAARTFMQDKFLVRFRVEAVQRLDSSPAGTSGTVIGLFNFNQPGQSIKRAWTQFGTDFVYSINNRTNLTASVNTATTGEDPVILGSVGVQVKF